MTIINVTEDRKHELQERVCSTEIIGEIHNQLICLSVINSFLSITAFLGNTLILVALHKESSLHAPSKLLFRSLATTDLCVGIIVEPLVVTFCLSAVHEQWHICHFVHDAVYTAGYILCSVPMLTVTAIKVWFAAKFGA